MWHGYFGIENLALNDEQRAAIVAQLQALGPSSSRFPAYLCHWRTRLDGQAAIFEALFSMENITIDAFKNRLAVIFDVAAETIDHALDFVTFGGTYDTPIVTFGRTGTDYLRLALFAGTAATWMQSGDEARAYLAANIEEWEEEEP